LRPILRLTVSPGTHYSTSDDHQKKSPSAFPEKFLLPSLLSARHALGILDHAFPSSQALSRLVRLSGDFFTQTSLSLAAPAAMQGDAAVQMAMADFNKKTYDAALRDLEPALQANPQNAEALNLKGAILTKQKNYDTALACYNEALKVSPGFFPARYNIGALLALRHQWDASIDYFRNLLVEQTNIELVEYKLLLLLLRQNVDPELQAKLFATDLPTDTPAWYYAKASRLFKKGEAKRSCKIY
jgi:tetratricopeptide (TPR) repeat protein